MFWAMARPIEPNPIHPTRDDSSAAMLLIMPLAVVPGVEAVYE